MKLSEILELMQDEQTYIDGMHTGLDLLINLYPHLNYGDWKIDHDDIASDYRLLVTTLKQDIAKYEE